jgi:hypothetical protein
MSVTTNAILEPGRNTPVFGEYDVVPLGGGPAGFLRRPRRMYDLRMVR